MNTSNKEPKEDCKTEEPETFTLVNKRDLEDKRIYLNNKIKRDTCSNITIHEEIAFSEVEFFRYVIAPLLNENPQEQSSSETRDSEDKVPCVENISEPNFSMERHWEKFKSEDPMRKTWVPFKPFMNMSREEIFEYVGAYSGEVSKDLERRFQIGLSEWFEVKLFIEYFGRNFYLLPLLYENKEKFATDDYILLSGFLFKDTFGQFTLEWLKDLMNSTSVIRKIEHLTGLEFDRVRITSLLFKLYKILFNRSVCQHGHTVDLW